MTNEYTDLVVGFGENLDAYAKWDAKVPTYLKQKLQPRQTAADEIHVYAKPGSLSAIEREHLLELVDPKDLPDGGGLHPPKATEEVGGDGKRDPGPLPEALLSAPGFVDELMAHTLKTAPYPNKTLAFAGALTMLAHLSGRRYRDKRNLRTNIYLIALAESGAGKDHPRKVNVNLAAAVGLMPTMADRFASGPGLEDALLLKPASFFQIDEADTLFKCLQDKDSTTEQIYGALLQFFTSADTVYSMRKKALQSASAKPNPFDKLRAAGIREPHLVMLGTAVPRYFYQALSERALENGLLSRCLVLEAGERGKSGNPHYEPFPERVRTAAEKFAREGGFEGIDLAKPEAPVAMPEPMVVPETDLATVAYRQVVAATEARYDAAPDTTGKALWTRAAEKTMKLALLYAISQNPQSPLITPEAVRWGWAIVDHLTRRMLYQASMYVADNNFDAYRQKAVRYLRDYGHGSLNHGQLLRYMHIDADTFRKVIDTLTESEMIVSHPLSKGGFRYSLVNL